MSDPTPINLATAALQDRSLSAKDLALKIVVQCRRAVQLATADAIASGRAEDDSSGDTPGLECYLWDIWFALSDAAADDPSRHDVFTDVLVALKASGDEDKQWRIWGALFDWANLPIWGPTIAETMNWGPIRGSDEEGNPIQFPDEELGQSILAGDPPADTVEARGWARGRARWLGYNAFRARLWALGADEDTYWPIIMLSSHLEPLALPEKVWRAKVEDPTLPRELGVETAMTWLRVAGAPIFACRETWDQNDESVRGLGASDGTWNGVAGYHPDRWAHWKYILRALVTGEKGEWRPNVIEAAKLTLESMNKVDGTNAQ